MMSDSHFQLSRRTFLQATALAGSAATAFGAARLLPPDLERRQFVFIWLQGGLSPLESFDPKPQSRAEIRGESSAIATSIPSVRFSDHFPRLAERAARLCVIRSLVPGNDRHGLAEASLLSGIPATAAETEPRESYGAWLANRFGPRDGFWPHFQIGRQFDTRYGGGGIGDLPFFTGPLVIPSREEYSREESRSIPQDFLFPGGVRFQRLVAACGPRPALSRFESAWRLISDRLQQLNGDRGTESDPMANQMVAAAHRWHVSSSMRELLDLSGERPAIRARYGETTLGDDFLQARRLIAAGARCVTITSGGWDHHTNIADEMRQRSPRLDTALAALLDDLDQRGLLATTTIVCLTDFGRTPHLNSSGGRDHWSQTGICLLAGAGVPKGECLGVTDSEGSSVVDNPCTPDNLYEMLTGSAVTT